MSINATGTAAPINIDALPGTASLPISTATASITASSFVDTNVQASIASIPITAINASALNSTNITASLATLPIVGLQASVIGTPETQDTPVIASTAAVPIVANNALIGLPLSDTPDYPDPVAGVVRIEQAVVNVSNDTELTNAINAATAGSTIQLAAGNYGGRTISRSFAAQDALLIKGAENFASKFTGNVTMAGQYNILFGVEFDGANYRPGGFNNKIIACKLHGYKGNQIAPKSTSPSGSNLEVAYCEIYSPGAWNFSYPPTEFRMGIRAQSAGNGQPETLHDGGWLHHCYFHDHPQKPDPNNYSSGQSDCIEIGESNYDWSLLHDSGWYIESNLIQNNNQSGGGTMVDNKIGGIVFRYNTVKNNAVNRADQRVGSFSIFESNWIQNGSMAFHSKGHKIVKNYLGNGAGILVLAGTDPWNTQTNSHPACIDTFVSGNEATVRVGYQYNSGHTVAAANTVVEDHNGAVVLGNETNTTNTPNAPSTYSALDPVELFVADVGPDALANASAAYKAARGL